MTKTTRGWIQDPPNCVMERGIREGTFMISTHGQDPSRDVYNSLLELKGGVRNPPHICVVIYVGWRSSRTL